MIDPSVIDAMVAAGASAEVIAAAIKADHALSQAKANKKREQAAERQRNRRIRHAESRDVTQEKRDTALQSVTERDPLSPPSSPKEVSPYNPLQEITPPSSSIPGARVRASDFPPDAFDQFWARVPRREGKAAAKRKFDQIRKAGDVPFAKLLLGIERYAAAMRTVEPQFVKHPATWLNAGCWDDEIAPRVTGPPKRAGPQGFETLFQQPEFADHGAEHRPDFDLDLTANRTD